MVPKPMLSGCINRGKGYRAEEVTDTFTLRSSWPPLEYGVSFWQCRFSADIYREGQCRTMRMTRRLSTALQKPGLEGAGPLAAGSPHGAPPGRGLCPLKQCCAPEPPAMLEVFSVPAVQSLLDRCGFWAINMWELNF